jgi:hypothetical protein
MIQVVDEQPAEDPAEVILRQLVTHYAQPIHVGSLDTALSFEQQGNEGSSTSSPLSPVLNHCWKRWQEEKKENASSVGNLLLLYPSVIRPAVYLADDKGGVHATGVPVLLQYDRLVELALEEEYPDVTERPPRNPKEDLTPVLRRLTVDLAEGTRLASQATAANTGSVLAHRGLLQNHVLPLTIRLLQACQWLAGEPDDAAAKAAHAEAAVGLLAWGSPRLDAGQVSPALILDLQETASRYALVPPGKEGDHSLLADMDRFVGEGVSLPSDDWDNDGGVAGRAAVRYWARQSSATHTQAQQQEVLLERLGTAVSAAAVRRHFFGKVQAAVPDDHAMVVPKTRLHLGVTVPVEAVEYEKAYREAPARMHMACRYISLLTTVSRPLLEEMAPILYELLTATQEAIQGMGAASLYHLLQCRTARDCETWPGAVLSNCAQLVDAAVRTCRQGPVLAALGVTQTVLLRRLGDGALLRRKVTQQWLMILQANPAKAPLVLGLLCGIVRLLFDHARQDSADALELGRLALQGLLPLIRRAQFGVIEEDGHDSNDDSEAAQVQMLSLITLTNLLVAAHPVVAHHEGKLIASLLVAIARTTDPGVTMWARHAGAMVVVICGETKLRQLMDSGDYEVRLNQVANVILEEAQRIREGLKGT